jgi:hypothetical protein
VGDQLERLVAEGERELCRAIRSAHWLASDSAVKPTVFGGPGSRGRVGRFEVQLRAPCPVPCPLRGRGHGGTVVLDRAGAR